MKKLLPLLMVGALCTTPSLSAGQVAPEKIKVHEMTLRNSATTQAKAVKNLNPLAVADGNSVTLWESFECPDKNLPEGWLTQKQNQEDWMIYSPSSYGMSAPDGNWAILGTAITLHDASWLMSPEFTVKDGEQLMFDLYFDVRSLYVWTTQGEEKTIDEEDGLILKRVNAENMKICISEEGGDWVELKNLWNEYGTLGYHEILDLYASAEFRHFVIPLDKFAGKKVRLGFCHQYLDDMGGHGMFLDAVRVSLPPVEASYQLPVGSMFWGFDNYLQGVAGYALMPYYTDLTWMNGTQGEGMTYGWEYAGFVSGEKYTSTGTDLVTAYRPDYSENPEATHTLYTFPTLSATNPAGTTGTYTYGNERGYIFAGAEASLPMREGGEVKYGLSTFDYGDDFQVFNADFSTPAWGHSAMTSDWWTAHMLRGAEEGDRVEIVNNINLFQSNGATMVVDGLRITAMVICEADAKFVLDLYEVDEDFAITENKIATATINGSDLIQIDDSYAFFPNTCILPFKFDAPVVIDGKNFAAIISGFNSEKVTYYAPYQSYKPAMNFGFTTAHITSSSMGEFDHIMSLGALDNKSYGSFAMALDAHYPYLVCNETEFEASAEQPSKTFNLESSYPAEELTVADASGELPQWIKVEKTGRYGNAKLTLTVDNGSDANETASLIVSAPGVSKTIAVKRGQWSGISQIEAGSSEVTATRWFDMSGRRLMSEPESGMSIVERVHADGSVTIEKVVK